MINKIISDVKNTEISITGWLLSFFSIIFIRMLLESISSPTSDGVIPSDIHTIVHYILFYLSVVLGTGIIIGQITNDHKNSVKIVLFGLPLLWLAPILDIIISRGNGFKMLYLFDTGKNIILNFFTYFGNNFEYGATYGMRVGIALSILGLGYYVWLEKKNIYKTLLSIFLMYVLVFVVGSLPGIFYTISNPNNTIANNTEVVLYFKNIIDESTISHNTTRDGATSLSTGRFLELGFNKLMTQVLFIISLIFGSVFLWKTKRIKLISVLKNIRIERVNFYTFSILSGMGLAYINKLNSPFSWIDIVGATCLLVSWVCLWMHAVHKNDIEDLEIDKISNTERPLVKEDLDKKEMSEVGILWLFIGLFGAWASGFYPFFMALVYVSCSYIYSSPPLRLRKYPLIPSFLISIACLSTILAGFFFVSTNKHILTFPPILAIGILIVVTLAINFKDIKDISGDKANGVITIPTLFPKHGVKIVALLFSLSIILVPLFLNFYFLYIFAIPCAIVGYKIITKKPYREKPVFILRFIFLLGIAFSYLLAYWLMHY